MSNFTFLHHGRDFRLVGEKSAWDLRLLAAVVVLSEFMLGQGVNMGSLVCYAVELRVGNGRSKQELVVKEADVKRVMRDLLQPLHGLVCFFLLGLTHPDDYRWPKSNIIVRKRKAKYNQRRRVENKGKGIGGVEENLDDIIMGGVGAELDQTGL
jgi:hypothetical protein